MFITDLIHSLGYFAVFVLMALESALVPIPSEVTMPFAGYLASQGVLNLWFVVLLGALGNLAGSLVGYFIGHFFEEHLLLKLIQKYGRYLFIKESDYHRGASWFAKYGDVAVFFSRLLPVVRTFISLPAGVFKMNIWKFSVYTFIGSLLWSLMLTYVGFTLGAQWHNVGALLRPLEYIVVVGVMFFVGYFLYRRLHK